MISNTTTVTQKKKNADTARAGAFFELPQPSHGNNIVPRAHTASLARTHERNEYDFPVWATPQPPIYIYIIYVLAVVAITNAAHQPPPSHIRFHPPITHHNHKVSIVIKTIAATHFSAETNVNCVKAARTELETMATLTYSVPRLATSYKTNASAVNSLAARRFSNTFKQASKYHGSCIMSYLIHLHRTCIQL